MTLSINSNNLNLNSFYANKNYLNKPVKSNLSEKLLSFSGRKIDYGKDIKNLQINLNTLGIEAYLSDKNNFKNYIVAKSIHDAIFDIHNAGIKIRKKLIIHCDEAENTFKHGIDDMAYTDIGRNTSAEMYFNTPKYITRSIYPYAIHKNGDPIIYNAKMDTYHEFAHYLQSAADIENYLSNINKKFDKKTSKEIVKRMDEGAALDKAEFVAEYFAYKMGDIKISPGKIDFEELYKECKGPKLPKLRLFA